MTLPLSRDRWPAEWRELFEERAGIMQFEGDMELPRELAEAMAEWDVRKLAAREKREESTP